jgi:hypothetical protein
MVKGQGYRVKGEGLRVIWSRIQDLGLRIKGRI